MTQPIEKKPFVPQPKKVPFEVLVHKMNNNQLRAELVRRMDERRTRARLDLDRAYAIVLSLEMGYRGNDPYRLIQPKRPKRGRMRKEA